MNKLLSFLLISLVTLSACGQKGSLYIPGSSATQTQTDKAKTSEEEESDRSSESSTE